jgi:hypothetical protein
VSRFVSTGSAREILEHDIIVLNPVVSGAKSRMKKRITPPEKRSALRRQEHNRKHTLLRRECYKWLRKNIPEVYEKLRKKAGLTRPGRPKA